MTRIEGEQHPAATLTEADVIAFRKATREELARLRAASKGLTDKGTPLRFVLRHRARDLPGLFSTWAKQHNVTRSAISMAVYGDTWAHVPGAVPKPKR